jgi:hypothetical protein
MNVITKYTGKTGKKILFTSYSQLGLSQIDLMHILQVNQMPQVNRPGRVQIGHNRVKVGTENRRDS